MEELSLKKFEEAAEKVKEVTLATNLVYSEYFSNQSGNKVYLKPENMQYTGAYKVRGAYYKISTMSEDARKKGLITASAGNHAQGVAYAASKYGVPATVVMPTTTPLIKVNRTKGYGAKVVLYGNVYDEACEYAMKLAKEQGLLVGTSSGANVFAAMQMAEKYGAEQVIYSHCHGRERYDDSFKGEVNGIMYRLVSSDYLKFRPERIL